MSKLLVYRASAGSGKTFMLVRKYLEQAFLFPGEYRKILAVTFTNKAADEMKGRILQELDVLDKTPGLSGHLDFLSASLNKPEEWIRKTAGKIKSQMIHDYTRISVGTIDAFFQQVLRSFARESGLSSSFQIELDTNLVLERFSKSIYAEAVENKELMGWLVEWVTERMENSETWHRLDTDLIRLGNELLKEDVLSLFVADDSQVPTPGQISKIRQLCRRNIKEFNDGRAEIAAAAALIIGNSNLAIDDFSYGMAGPAGFLLKLADAREGPKKRSLDSLGNPDKWVSKKSPPAVRNSIVNNLYPELNRLMDKAIQLYREKFILFNSSRAINKNLFALGFSAFLFDFFRNYFNQNDQLLLSLTQPLVNQIIGNNPSPFIYEKTGTFFSHFLIDEFQDTSDLQWKNFKPLIVDSLSSDGLSLLVGDIKQSIYRWRNSNWRLLHQNAVNDLKPFESTFEPLDRNQRSRRSIIEFNNQVFSKLTSIIKDRLDSSFLEDDITGFQPTAIIKDVFDQSAQVMGMMSDLDGRVEVHFLDKTDKASDWKEKLETELPAIVEDLLVNKGYCQEDITFLVRRNTDADVIAKVLSNTGKNWTFISSDVFRIANSPVIKMIISAMRFMADPSKSLYRDLFLWDAYTRSHYGNLPVPGFQAGELENFQGFIESVREKDLLTVTDAFIRAYHLDDSEHDLAYLFQFRDQVKGCMGKGISHLDGFLNWWDSSGSNQMLASESFGSSMRIMTIHKAKGLSSPVIIIPYCNWDFDHSAKRAPWLWVSTRGTVFSEAGLIPVKYDSGLVNSFFAGDYLSEKIDSYLDNLNLLYVAFTRAIDVLIVFCPYGTGFRTVAEAMFSLLNQDLDEDAVFRLGNPAFRNIHKKGRQNPEIRFNVPMIRGNLKSIISEPDNDDFEGTRFGKNVHYILENVETSNDLSISIKHSVSSGYFTSEEALSVEARIKHLFAMPKVDDWFGGNWEILNEAGILVPGFGLKRPDRVMIWQGRVVVLDYKTGLPENEHHKQVATYMKLLLDMGYTEVEGYLLYIETGSLVEVRSPSGSSLPDPMNLAF